MVLEALDSVEAYRIDSSPGIVGSCDAPVGQEVTLGAPVGEAVLHGQDDKEEDGPTEGIESLDCRRCLA